MCDCVGVGCKLCFDILGLEVGANMRAARCVISLLAVFLAIPLMGQARHCGDINEIVPQLDRILGIEPGKPVYFSSLSIMDDDSKSVMVTGDAEHINVAVTEGIKALTAADPRYIFNSPGRSVSNTDATAHRLFSILWDANMSRLEKTDLLIAEFLAPHKLDALIFGQSREKKDGTLSVRLIVLAQAPRSFVTESRSFTRQEFNCTDPQQPSRKVLCQKTREDIRDTAVRLLKQL